MQLNLMIQLIVNLLTFLTVREIATTMLRQTKLNHRGEGTGGGFASAGTRTSADWFQTFEAYLIQAWQVSSPQAGYPDSHSSS